MPKIKTHKGARARYGVTGSGKIYRMKRHSSHLRRKKPKSVRRLYDSKLVVENKGQRERVQTLIPAYNK